MIWRLSAADVEASGPFSHFPGVRRVLTVLTGRGLILRHPGGEIAAELGVPVRFAGDLPIDCLLVDGPVRDFNLMFDPDHVQMDVERLNPGEHDIEAFALLALGAPCSVIDFGDVPAGFALLAGVSRRMRINVRGHALIVTMSQARSINADTARL